MIGKWLYIINMLTLPIILLIGISFWIYAPFQLEWGVILIILILLFVGYANVRKPIHDYIDARRKAKNMPEDIKGERRLRFINDLAILGIFAIGALGWVYFNEQFTYVAYLVILILILVCFVNVHKVIRDIS